MPGPAAKPRALRIVEGNAARRPLPDEINFGKGLPTKPQFPDELDDDGNWLWDQIVAQAKDSGLLKPINAAPMEHVCQTFSRWRQAVRLRQAQGIMSENSQGQVIAPWVKVEESSGREFRAWCKEFGLTPAAEASLKGPNEDDEEGNPFA